MDKIDERYKRGKIYTIRCRYDNTLIYVGSTIQKLSKRMVTHRSNEKCSLFQFVKKGDWKNWYIELYEEYPCNNKGILEKREGEVIRLMGTINKSIAGRTQKESQKNYYENNKEELNEKKKKYYENNKEKINEKHKIYYENNKEKVSEKHKKWYENNVDKIAKQRKQYQQENADKIAERKKQKIECDKCKSIVCRGDISKHKKTKKCLNYNICNN
jgi:hypothetical protein